MTAANRIGLLLFLLFQSLYALTSSGNAFRLPDEFEVYFQVEHLVDTGDLSVPQAVAIRRPVVANGKVIGMQSVFFGKVGKDGKPYAPYGPLAAVLSWPHHLAGRGLARVAGVPRAEAGKGLAWVILVGGVTMLVSATGAALAVAGFYRAALALGTPATTAVILSLLLGGATVLWPYGATLYSEALQAAALVWAAALLLEAKRGAAKARARVMTAALLLGVAGLVKFTALVFAPAFVVAALWDRSLPARTRRDVAVALAIGIALAAAVHFRWNDYRFDSPFDFGYDWSETIPTPPARAFAITDLPRGIAVLLATPGKSILLWAPVLFLALASSRRFWQREPAVAVGVAAALAAGLLIFGAYLFPEGGYSHGPRNLVPILPLLLLPAAGADARRWPRSVLVACGAVGAVMALLAVSVSYLEDQAMGGGPSAAARSHYYEQVVPAPGRPSNRYRLGYLPFVNAMRSPGWVTAQPLGQGPDFFPLHLAQARAQLPDGKAIPAWLVWVWPAGWLALLVAASWALARQFPTGSTRLTEIPRIATSMSGPMPFNVKRMSMGGFRSIVDM